VRDSSAEALGAIYKALGEKIFMPNVGELEQIKLDKIKEYAEKTVLLNLKGEPRANATASVSVAVKPVAVAAATAAVDKKKPIIAKPSENSSSAAPAKPLSSAVLNFLFCLKEFEK
jgi:hypothetical protein